MDKETKQDLLTIALLMKKAREQEESNKQAKDQYSECDVEATAETCLSDDDEQFLETQDEALETQDDADRLVRQLLSSGIDKYEDMIRHVALKQPDEYKRLKPLLRKTWNFWCRNPRMEITYERSKEICEKIEAEMTKEASEQRHKKYDMKTMKGRLLAAIEDHIVTSENFGSAEELLLAIWLRSKEDPSISIKYDYCQSRTAVRLTFDKERHFVNGIYWDYDVDNDELGELSVKILGHEFTHQAVWERYADSWYEYRWLGPNDEVCDALNDVLDMCVHSGGCDEWVYCEEPFVDKYIIASALENTRRHEYCHFYVLADRDNQVYLASDIKRDIDECAEYWVLFDGRMSGDKQERVSLGRLRRISDEESVQLLLKQKLVVSQEFDDDAIWLPKEGKLMPLQAMANETVHLPRPLSDGRYLARDLAHALNKAFKEHSYTPSAIAAGVGLDRHEVVAWSKGRGLIPHKCLQMLCKHMGIAVDDLGVDLRGERSCSKM